jgi:RNA polymerase sigma factor (sigma-70 family)
VSKDNDADRLRWCGCHMAETTTASQDDEPGPGDEGAEIADLVARARSGDQGALDEIVDRCSPMLRAVARRYVRRPADVEDVVQDVWVSFVEHLDHIRSPEATRAWLARVATHAAWRACRRLDRAAPVAELGHWSSLDDTEESGLRNARRAEVEGPLRAALDDLRPADRRLVERLVADDRPDYRTISEELGRPIGSLGPTRQRALARLRRQPAIARLAVA